PRSPLFPYTTLFRSAAARVLIGVTVARLVLAGVVLEAHRGIEACGDSAAGTHQFPLAVVNEALAGTEEVHRVDRHEGGLDGAVGDRKSTRLNSSHVA